MLIDSHIDILEQTKLLRQTCYIKILRHVQEVKLALSGDTSVMELHVVLLLGLVCLLSILFKSDSDGQYRLFLFACLDGSCGNPA